MKVQCIFKAYSNSLIPNAYSCEVRSISITKPGTEMKEFDGTHDQGKTDSDVEMLRINNQNVRFCPRNIHKVFPNLKFLAITRCCLEEIWRQDLICLKNLEIINLFNNKLTSLPSDLFIDLKKLRKINLSNNQIKDLSSKILNPIASKLEWINLKGNDAINDCYDKKDDLAQFMRTIDSHCTVPELQVGEQSTRQSEHHRNTFAVFNEFRKSGEFTDFTIKVHGKEFKVHRCILAAQSSVFKRMFNSETADTAKIKDLSENAFDIFLNYFYTGQVADENAIEMFQLASEFDVQELKAACFEKILHNLSDSNALEVFNLAHEHASEELKQSAFAVIKETFPDIQDSLVNDSNHVNRLVKAKREFDAILGAATNVKI